ncbi:hypothetical protein ACFYRY_32395 [Streptomyces sp. NPDC005263]|uniref:hypothetical protein n=1 Tax=Streptomyces sp. NPDC005263 TaxID=3364711 RepID=UPI00368E776E
MGGPPPGSSVPGPAAVTTAASVVGPRRSRRDSRAADRESNAHIPTRIGETDTAGMNGTS